MSRQPPANPLKHAIDKGRIADVRKWLQAHLAPRQNWGRYEEPRDPTLVPCEYDSEDQEEAFNPLQRAMAREKTNLVFLFLDHGWQITPEQENDSGLFGEFRPEGQFRPTTNAQATFQAVMRYVRTHNMFKPLLKPHRQRLEVLRDQLMAEEGPDLTLLRTMHTPAEWLSWVPAFLKAGANPNAHTLDPEHGQTLHVLTLASTNGMVKDTQALLEGGANPLWKQHDWTTPAHTAADLLSQGNMVLSTKSMVSLKVVERRKDCLALLLQQPGVANQPDFHGRTPAQLWKTSLEALAQGWKGPDDRTPEADRVEFRKQLLELILPIEAEAAPPTSRPRF